MTHDETWTTLHDLAMVFLALTHGTDDHLHDDELELMVEKLGAWDPGLHQEQVREVVMEALAVYMECDRKKELTRAMLSIRNTVPAVERLFALDDLIELAEADGQYLDAEKGLITAIRRIWEIDRS